MIERDRSRLAAPASFVRGASTWVAYTLLALFAYLETALGPAMPFLREALDLDYTIASLHFSMFAIGGILIGLVGDRLMHKAGRKAALWGGLAGMVTGAAVIALSPHVLGTLLGAFSMGWLGTLSLVANQSTLSDLHGDRRATALAESNVAASAAAVSAPLAIGGAAASGLGWSYGLLLAIPAFLFLVWRFLPVPIPQRRLPASERRRSSPLPRVFWAFWFALFCAAAMEWCIAYWGADVLVTIAGLSASAAATSMSVFFFAMVGGRLAGARLSRRRPATTLLIAALALVAAGFPFFWLGGRPVVNLIGLFVAGAGIANLYPMTIAAATSVAADQIEQATSRLAISGAGALLLGPLIVGAIADAIGLRWGIGIVIPLLVGAALATLTATRMADVAPSSAANRSDGLP